MKKITRAAVAVYLAASLLFSIAHAVARDPWEFRNHRNGLLCVDYTRTETGHDVTIWSPFCNHCDVFLLCIEWNADGLHLASDGLDCFGQWAACN